MTTPRPLQNISNALGGRGRRKGRERTASPAMLLGFLNDENDLAEAGAPFQHTMDMADESHLAALLKQASLELADSGPEPKDQSLNESSVDSGFVDLLMESLTSPQLPAALAKSPAATVVYSAARAMTNKKRRLTVDEDTIRGLLDGDMDASPGPATATSAAPSPLTPGVPSPAPFANDAMKKGSKDRRKTADAEEINDLLHRLLANEEVQNFLEGSDAKAIDPSPGRVGVTPVAPGGPPSPFVDTESPIVSSARERRATASPSIFLQLIAEGLLADKDGAESAATDCDGGAEGVAGDPHASPDPQRGASSYTPKRRATPPSGMSEGKQRRSLPRASPGGPFGAPEVTLGRSTDDAASASPAKENATGAARQASTAATRGDTASLTEMLILMPPAASAEKPLRKGRQASPTTSPWATTRPLPSAGETVEAPVMAELLELEAATASPEASPAPLPRRSPRLRKSANPAPAPASPPTVPTFSPSEASSSPASLAGETLSPPVAAGDDVPSGSFQMSTNLRLAPPSPASSTSTIPDAPTPKPNVPLRSCLSSRKAQAPLPHPPSSRRVAFGSPSAVEFDHKHPPSMLTPLTKTDARLLFSQPRSRAPVGGPRPPTPLSEETARNEEILVTWEEDVAKAPRSAQRRRRQSIGQGDSGGSGKRRASVSEVIAAAMAPPSSPLSDEDAEDGGKSLDMGSSNEDVVGDDDNTVNLEGGLTELLRGIPTVQEETSSFHSSNTSADVADNHVGDYEEIAAVKTATGQEARSEADDDEEEEEEEDATVALEATLGGLLGQEASPASDDYRPRAIPSPPPSASSSSTTSMDPDQDDHTVELEATLAALLPSVAQLSSPLSADAPPPSSPGFPEQGETSQDDATVALEDGITELVREVRPLEDRSQHQQRQGTPHLLRGLAPPLAPEAQESPSALGEKRKSAAPEPEEPAAEWSPGWTGPKRQRTKQRTPCAFSPLPSPSEYRTHPKEAIGTDTMDTEAPAEDVGFALDQSAMSIGSTDRMSMDRMSIASPPPPTPALAPLLAFVSDVCHRAINRVQPPAPELLRCLGTAVQASESSVTGRLCQRNAVSLLDTAVGSLEGFAPGTPLEKLLPPLLTRDVGRALARHHDGQGDEELIVLADACVARVTRQLLHWEAAALQSFITGVEEMRAGIADLDARLSEVLARTAALRARAEDAQRQRRKAGEQRQRARGAVERQERRRAARAEVDALEASVAAAKGNVTAHLETAAGAVARGHHAQLKLTFCATAQQNARAVERARRDVATAEDRYHVARRLRLWRPRAFRAYKVAVAVEHPHGSRSVFEVAVGKNGGVAAVKLTLEGESRGARAQDKVLDLMLRQLQHNLGWCQKRFEADEACLSDALQQLEWMASRMHRLADDVGQLEAERDLKVEVAVVAPKGVADAVAIGAAAGAGGGEAAVWVRVEGRGLEVLVEITESYPFVPLRILVPRARASQAKELQQRVQQATGKIPVGFGFLRRLFA